MGWQSPMGMIRAYRIRTSYRIKTHTGAIFYSSANLSSAQKLQHRNGVDRYNFRTRATITNSIYKLLLLLYGIVRMLNDTRANDARVHQQSCGCSSSQHRESAPCRRRPSLTYTTLRTCTLIKLLVGFHDHNILRRFSLNMQNIISTICAFSR